MAKQSGSQTSPDTWAMNRTGTSWKDGSIKSGAWPPHYKSHREARVPLLVSASFRRFVKHETRPVVNPPQTGGKLWPQTGPQNFGPVAMPASRSACPIRSSPSASKTPQAKTPRGWTRNHTKKKHLRNPGMIRFPGKIPTNHGFP